MNFFGVAPTKVIVFREGYAFMTDDAEPEEGVTSPDMLPKFKIMAPGMDEETIPKGNWKDAAVSFVVPQTPAGVDEFLSSFKPQRAIEEVDFNPPNPMLEATMPDTITLYRGLETKFNPNYDTNKTDAPPGYSTWTDNPDLARQYAGRHGFVYKLELPTSELGNEYIDVDGERVLFFANLKPAGLNGISGNEYLVYTHHEKYDPTSIKLV